MFHQFCIVANRINHIDLHVTHVTAVLSVERNIFSFSYLVFANTFAYFISRLGKRSRGRAAIGYVELDAKITIGSTGVVTGRQDNAASCTVFPYQA